LHFVDNLNPVLMHIGPVQIHWYGMMYALSFIIGYFLICHLAPKRGVPLNSDGAAQLIYALAAGVLFGGRLGYVLFYNLPYYIHHPAKILAVWDGGMSFHGGLIGVITAALIFSHKTGIRFLSLADLVAPVVPIALFLGRLGNFINGELWGRPSNVSWAMIFPKAPLVNGMMVPRHPSQLYEAALEGVVLFTILWTMARKPRPEGVVLGTFLTLYGIFRCFVEFFREPDSQLGLIGGFISMGQILSLPMILVGVCIIVWALRQRRSTGENFPIRCTSRQVR
jgi:phosphatidylglycerol---prolipoprotein diacylglyceryl transferase